MMKLFGPPRRLAIAFVLSIVLNFAFVTIDFSIDPRQHNLSILQNAVVGLLRPAEALSMRFTPGHGGLQILGLVIFSILIYAFLGWIILSLPVWWRHRT